jgi:hypothetical protein
MNRTTLLQATTEYRSNLYSRLEKHIMTTTVTPRLGSIVLYTLSEFDARAIAEQRRDSGRATSRGNEVHEGDTYPAMIVRDWAVAPEEQARIRAKTARGEYLPEILRNVPGVEDDKLRRERVGFIAKQLAAYDSTNASASVNLQVFLDGTDVFWTTSRTQFDPERDADKESGEKGHWRRRTLLAEPLYADDDTEDDTED